MKTRHPSLEGCLERLALFTAIFAPDRAPRLLEQLSADIREEALQHSRHLASLEQASRQGRVARVFGERPDAGARLRALLAEARPGLARELWARMPPHHRASLHELARLDPVEPRLSSAMNALAARLIKEATR